MFSNPKSLSHQFFTELKQYNSTNFKALYTAKLTEDNPAIMKAFSSVITRFFIFCEKHPELSETERRMLYFQLKVDMIARFFSNYPNTNTDDLIAFQTELRYFIKENEHGGDTNVESAIAI